MRTVFFGTPDWAVPSLAALLASDMEVACVVTNPDRPAGRSLELKPSPVKQLALEAGIEVLQPERARDPELRERLSLLAPDVATVVAYGKLLPPSLLEVPRLGFVNVHFSLLPLYRGAAPVQHALMEGARETGVSIMVLTEGMDEGPLLASKPTYIDEDDTAGTLGQRLAEMGAPLLRATLPAYAQGTLVPRPQDPSRATYAPKISTEDARIDWTLPADVIRNLVRALNPSPGAWTTFRDKRVKLLRVATKDEGVLMPGELADSAALVGTGTSSLELVEVQMSGRRRMSGQELLRGLHPIPGEFFH